MRLVIKLYRYIRVRVMQITLQPYNSGTCSATSLYLRGLFIVG